MIELMAISNCGIRYFSVESWLRKANGDESAECATVGSAASVGILDKYYDIGPSTE
jgi:hypothetical protein